MSCKGAIKKTRSINADSMYPSKIAIEANSNLFFSIGDTLGMEGNVIERRPSTNQQAWFENKQQSYSNIFVTPPGEQERKLERMSEVDRDDSHIGKIVIKDRHEGIFKNYENIFEK